MTSIPTNRTPICFKPRHRRGFTLVEILTVIAVVAILAGIIFASLQRARESANAVTCASNMRQIHHGMMLMAQVENGRLPALWNQQPPFTNIANFNRQQEPISTRNLSFILFSKFDMSPDIFICPSGASVTGVTNHYRVQFSAHSDAGVSPAIFYPFGRSPDFGSNPGANEIDRPRTMSWLESNARAHPSNFVLLYESVVPGNPAYIQEMPHRGRMNMLFLDGSVRLLERGQAPIGNRDFDAFR